MIKSFFHLFFPNICISCSNGLEQNLEYLCISCLSELPVSSFTSWKENPLFERLESKMNISGVLYYLEFSKTSLAQNIIHSIKYENNNQVAVYFGKLFGEFLLTTGVGDIIDAIIYVPLHPKKQRKRGFNQSEMIAKGINQVLKKVVLKDVIVRLKHTTSQTTKTKQQRWEAMENIFELKKTKDILNKRLLIVDDVITTGATLGGLVDLLAPYNTKAYLAPLACVQ